MNAERGWAATMHPPFHQPLGRDTALRVLRRFQTPSDDSDFGSHRGAAFGGRTGPRGKLRRLRRSITPAQLLALVFLGLVAFGTIGLRALPGLYAEGVEPLGWLDALFTATSAVCVTGLIVVDTATYFSTWGQLYILLLIQLGGLGMVGLASLIIVAFSGRLSLRQDALARGSAATGAATNVSTRGLVRDVLIFTFGTEFLAFVALWALWWPRFGAGDAAWHAMFHSISAFCNAGFSTFSDNLIGIQNEPLTLLVIMGAVVVGGIGFLTLEEIKLWFRAKRAQRAFRLSLHTRLVLGSTLVFVLSGWVLLGALEWSNPRTLGPLGPTDALVNALFLSVTPRTAGFNSIDYAQAEQSTAFGTILLMSIGGAPGGTAGGIKVTTVALLLAMAYSRSKARRTTDIWDRTIPEATSQRAVGLFTFAFSIVTAGILLLCITELQTKYVGFAASGESLSVSMQFLDLMFEAASAFNTVGLSTGLTSQLTPPGQILIIVLMFVGRIGPLTFAAALSRHEAQQRLIRRFAHEDVVVG